VGKLTSRCQARERELASVQKRLSAALELSAKHEDAARLSALQAQLFDQERSGLQRLLHSYDQEEKRMQDSAQPHPTECVTHAERIAELQRQLTARDGWLEVRNTSPLMQQLDSLRAERTELQLMRDALRVQLAGVGVVDGTSTRVVHLRNNPAAMAAAAKWYVRESVPYTTSPFLVFRALSHTHTHSLSLLVSYVLTN
jgi:uncharacterized alpha-E superfamily protein